MKIKIRYFASIKEILGKNEEEIEVKEGITAGALKEKLLTMNSKITEKEQLLIAINGSFVDPKKKIKEGDVVALFPPVSGG
jgi:molybdopterin synthase sulfur carrier subunit